MLRQVTEAAASSTASVWVAAITAASATIIAIVPLLIMQKRNNSQVRAINDAVNHTHVTGTPRIYDIVEEIAGKVRLIEHATTDLVKWQNGYDGSPFTDTKAIQEFVDSVETRFDQLDTAIKSHVEWEERTKYTELEELMRGLSLALVNYHKEVGDEPHHR